MARLSDLERRAIKQRNSPAFKAEQARLKAEVHARKLAERRSRRLVLNLVQERRRAELNIDTAREIDRMIARGERGWNGSEIKPMGVDKYKAKYYAADRKLDSVTGEYDVDD